MTVPFEFGGIDFPNAEAVQEHAAAVLERWSGDKRKCRITGPDSRFVLDLLPAAVPFDEMSQRPTDRRDVIYAYVDQECSESPPCFWIGILNSDDRAMDVFFEWPLSVEGLAEVLMWHLGMGGSNLRVCDPYDSVALARYLAKIGLRWGHHSPVPHRLVGPDFGFVSAIFQSSCPVQWEPSQIVFISVMPNDQTDHTPLGPVFRVVALDLDNDFEDPVKVYSFQWMGKDWEATPMVRRMEGWHESHCEQSPVCRPRRISRFSAFQEFHWRLSK